ncbi:MAG: class I SAM-dependent methyltransferase [Bdellovibrionota bacterium]
MNGPEHTAVRVALWRALHVLNDQKPHIFKDEIGERLVGDNDWRSRPDMQPEFSKPMRASIVGRARLIEDLIEKEVKRGVTQYVILGAGLDTFAQRRPELASKMQIFEVDQTVPQAWKKERLSALGFINPAGLHFVPVDFEEQSWMTELVMAGFDISKSALVVSTGVSMYLTQEANREILKELAVLSVGSTFAMTFMLTLDMLQPQERNIMEFVMRKAKESGTPFLSLFTPQEITQLAKDCGFKEANYVLASEIFKSYFEGRKDGLRAGDAEAFLIART